VAARVPLAFAESKFQRLLSCAGTLGKDMTLDARSGLPVLMFWMLFHIVVLEIFRPWVQQPDDVQPLPATPLSSTPSSTFNASLRQLRRLMLEYLRRVPPADYSVWLNSAAMHVGTTMLKGTEDLTWPFYLRLCFAYWKSAALNYPVLSQVASASLAVALRVGALTASEAYAINKDMQTLVRHHEEGLAVIANTSVIDFDHNLVEIEGFRVFELAQSLDELTMFEEWTTAEDDNTSRMETSTM
jgi:hypothetical protein